MPFRIFFLLVVFSQASFAVKNGTPVTDNSYIQVGRFWLDQTVCSGTLVGPKVFVTAAHCLMAFGLQTKASFEIGDKSQAQHQVIELQQEDMTKSSYYGGVAGDSPDDLAIGVLKKPIKNVVPMTIETQEPQVGESITLAGWGDKEWTFDQLRIGTNLIRGFPLTYLETVPNEDNGVQSQGGDSGGATIVERDGHKRLVGVILGDGEGVTASTLLTTEHSLEFLKKIAIEKKLKICGINLLCEK